MASLDPTIEDKEFQNWLRGSLALLFTKQGLDGFMLEEITQFQRDLLTSIFRNNNISADNVCSTCTTENVLPCRTQNFCSKGKKCNSHNPALSDKSPSKACPNRICQDIREAIRREHRYNGPSWKNTDASKWCTNAMEIAKCYMPPDGYMNVTTIADTDFNGVLAVIMNNKRFQKKMTAQLDHPTNICSEAQEVGRVLRHCADLRSTDADLAKYIDILIDLLSDPKYLATDQNAQVAIERLKQLQSNTLSINTSDLILVLDNKLKDIVSGQKNDAIQLIDAKKDEVKGCVEEQIKALLKQLGDLENKHESTLQHIAAKIKSESDKEKQDILSTLSKERHLVTKEIKSVSEKEIQDLVSTGTKERQLVSKEIKSLSEKEKQDIVSTGSKERELVKSVSDMVKQDIESSGLKERELIIKEMETALAKGKHDLLVTATKHQNKSVMKRINLLHQPLKSKVSTTYMTNEQLKNCMRQDLICFYKTHHSAISIAPLVEEHKVPLVDFYVQPSLTIVDITTRHLGESQVGFPVQSYRKLFRSDGNMNRNIYITAKAGIGKTLFSKRICMAWCQAHSQQAQSLVHTFQAEDLEVMERFDFLFLVPLREANSLSCKVDDMIFDQIIKALADHDRYSRNFVKDVLENMSCLIVLDGLDEWTHPETCERRCNEHTIPHRPDWDRCSIVTTTRPWKLDCANVSVDQIDIQVDINELDQTSSESLTANAIFLLNKKNKEAKSVEEFNQATSFRNLEAMKYIPYILLQMICLWFDGKLEKKSKCEIYSKCLDLTFVRGLLKLGDTYWSSRRKQMPAIPSSIPARIVLHESCRSHMDVILDLGKVAFETFFTLNKESSLVFSKAVALKSISKEMLTFLLKIGLLSRNKDFGGVASRQSKFSFQHKSVQEYFAALYIHSNHDNQHMRQRICQACNSLTAVLEMSNVFIFLGGFSSETCGNILKLLQNTETVSNDNTVTHFRNECSNYSLIISSSKNRRSFLAVKAFRDMQTDIVQEIMNTGQTHFSLYTEDIIIQYALDKTLFNLLKPVIKNSKTSVKSVCIDNCLSTEDVSEVLDTFSLRNVNSLLKLSIHAIPTQPDLKYLLAGSVQTLKCCDIVYLKSDKNCYRLKYTKMSSENIGIILNMTQLQALTLAASGLTHSDINRLFKYLGDKTEMTEISLRSIFCTTHKGECTGYKLDLSQHQKLKYLDLDLGRGVSVSNLLVNPSSLKYCFIGRLPQHVYPPLFETLKHARVLRDLEIGFCFKAFGFLTDTLPKLSNIRTIVIRKINLEDRTFTLPPQMKKLNCVTFCKVHMTSAALRLLSDSVDILPRPVRCSLRACTVLPEYEYEQLKDVLRSSPKCRVIYDGSDSAMQSVFEFKTVCCHTDQ